MKVMWYNMALFDFKYCFFDILNQIVWGGGEKWVGGDVLEEKEEVVKKFF